MRVEIPNKRMQEKLELLLSGVPGTFEHHPIRSASNRPPCSAFSPKTGRLGVALVRMRERWPELRFEMKAGYLESIES
jgi:hypothetical protein